LHHPKIREGPIKSVARHEKFKSTGQSVNWSDGDERSEILDCKTGRVAGGNVPSRICKRSLFELFCNLMPKSKQISYGDNKQRALDYQTAKQAWLRVMEQNNKGQ